MVNNSADGLDVLLQPSGAPAFLPVSHLSDHQINCKALLSVYTPSTKLTNVVYYGRSKDKSMVSLYICVKLLFFKKMRFQEYVACRIDAIFLRFPSLRLPPSRVWRASSPVVLCLLRACLRLPEKREKITPVFLVCFVAGPRTRLNHLYSLSAS